MKTTNPCPKFDSLPLLLNLLFFVETEHMKHSLQNPGGKLLTYNLKKDAEGVKTTG